MTFPPRKNEATVPVTVLGDTLFEDDESLIVWFNSATNADTEGFHGLGLGITDNDD